MVNRQELVCSAATREALLGALDEASPARAAGPHRLVILAESAEDLAAKKERARELLRGPQKRFNVGNAVLYGCVEDVVGKTGFLFPGFGARHTNVLDDLGVRRRQSPLSESGGSAAALLDHLNDILIANLTLYDVLTRCGVRCEAMAGHSYGENAMLVAAGIVPDVEPVLDILQRIARAAGERFVEMPMLAVPSSRAHDANVTLAIDNCPQQAIVTGTPEALAQLEESVRARGEIVFRLPQLTIPVHTPHFPVAVDVLESIYRDVALSTPRVTAYSCATTEPLPEDIRSLLVQQWIAPVRFRETIERMYADGVRTFVEVGPGDRLAGFVRDTLRGRDALAISTNHESRPAMQQLRIALAQLFVRGCFEWADRAETPAEPMASRAAGRARPPEAPPVVQRILHETAAILGLTSSDLLDPQRGFFELGLTSLGCVELADRLRQPQTIAFDFPTPARLAAHLDGATVSTAQRRETNEAEPIAIVGIGCRFPGGADTPDKFWQLLDEGRDAIVEVPPERWSHEPAAPRFGGFLTAPVDRFDASFFGISPREALTLDPQQRLLLEVTWEALENAAIDPRALAGSATAVFVGISGNDYAGRLPPSQRAQIGGYIATGNASSTAAGRLSFFLGTHGPSMALDTACSSSLVAVHLAAQSLRRGESDLALAGGVNLILSPETSVYLARAHALSPRGRCRTFDAGADGYVRAEGCGVVVLKRLSDAQKDGDRILAVVAGSAVNHDGRTSGLTVPNGVSQQQVLERALADARVESSQVSFVETHGTGTPLGDPIEVQALGRVYRSPLILGALKTNIGHLEAAAGVAGLIKVVLQLQRGRIAGALHQEEPNPKIAWSTLPFRVPQRMEEWSGGMAGVSSFGISGTNAHVIVSAWKGEQPAGTPRNTHVLTLSAHTDEALDVMCARLHIEDDLADVAYTTNIGRAHFRKRRAIVASDAAEAMAQLRVQASRKSADKPRIAFLFSGQGSQYAGMARELMASEPLFRRTLEELDAVRWLECDDIHQTANAQPALFALEYALATLWRSWGIEPAAVLGHSVGEYVAATIAGVFTPADALRLVVARGRLMQSLPAGGAMLVVPSFENDEGLDVAAYNGPRNVVLSGPVAAIEAAEARRAARGERTTRLTVSHAFHSSLVEPIVDAFRDEASRVTMRAPSLPLIANLTGRRADASFATADAWAAQLRNPVRFADGMRALIDEGCNTFVEIGPKPVLIAMAPECTDRDVRWLASLRPPQSDERQMLETLGALYEAGVDVDWRAFHAGRERRRVALPTYPFQRDRYWIEVQKEAAAIGDTATLHGERLALADADEVRFESRISTAGIFGDYRVANRHQFPISGSIAILAGAARAVTGDETITLLDFTPREPLLLDATPATLQTVIRGKSARVYVRRGDEWMLHAEATCGSPSPGSCGAPLSREPERADARSAAGEGLSNAFYEQWLARGLDCAKRFRVVQSIAAADGRAVAELSAKDEVTMLEGAFHALLAANDAMLPIERIARITLGTLPKQSRAVATRDSVTLTGATIEGVHFAQTKPKRTFREKLRAAADDAQREAMILRYLGQLATTILRLPRDRALDVNAPLTQLGFDSLLAMQFVNALQIDVGVSINVAALIDGRPLAALAPLVAKTPLPLAGEDSRAAAGEGLSYGQRALWFVWALAPQSHAYNVTLPVAVNDEDACRRLVHRHPMLRAIFPRRHGEPAVEFTDAFDYGEAASLDEAHRAPFDLERGPLVRFRWIATEGVLAVTMHHIITDGWSLEIIRRELTGETPLPLTHTYFDSVRWQRELLASADGERLWQFWRDELAPPLPRLELPTDRPRPPVQQFRGASVAFTLPPSLREIAHEEGATLNVVVMAAFFLLLHRLTNDDDILLGMPTAGRGRAELASIVGYFVDPVVIRARIDRDATFRAFVRELRTTVARAIEHRDFPFALLVEKLRAERDPSRSPLFDVSFNFISRSAPDVPQSEGKFDLTLTVDDALNATLGYDAELFDRETVKRFAETLVAIAENPDRRTQTLQPVLRGRRIDDLVPVWDRFAVEVARTPEAPAVTANGETLTYRELHDRAVAFSRELDEAIAIPAERSIEFVVAVLGALKAGVPYVPVDSPSPDALRTSTLSRSAGEGQRAAGAQGEGLSTVAYILYTSGTTGTPKGVAITQLALANYVASIIKDLELERGASYALVSTVAADLGNTMLFPSLCLGGHLHLVSDDVATNPRAFAEYLETHAIDYLKIVPSHLAALNALPRKAVILGGEPASPQWTRELVQQCRVYNHYGPTETTIGVLTARIDGTEDGRSLPLRRAVANCDLYLLDDELCVAGAPLARGYTNGDDGGFVTIDGIRLYRTGDRARLRADGSLEILGRRDRQVKLHGVRIELGHVEAVLRERCEQAVAMIDREQLVAFVTKPDAVPDHAAQTLPRAAVPSRIVEVASIPLTPNGKIDYAALRRTLTAPAKQTSSMPRDVIELRLAQLWSEVLDVPRVALDDDFFDLGGHSLLAVRLAGRIADEFGHRVPLATFFTHRTVARFAAFLRAAGATPSTSLLVPIQPNGKRAPLFCFPGAGGSVLYFHHLASRLGSDQPSYGVQGAGFENGDIPRSVEEVADHALRAIQAVQPHGPYHFAGHSFGALVAYEIARRLIARGEDVAFLGVIDNAAPSVKAAALPPHSETNWLRHIAVRIEKLYGIELRDAHDDASLIDAMIASTGGFDRQVFARYVAMYRANATAAATYRPQPSALPVRITLFRAGEDDPELRNATVDDASLGWSGWTDAPVDVIEVDGTHITMLTEPHVATLAARMRDALHAEKRA